MSYSPIPVDVNGFVPITTSADANVIDTLNSNTTPMLANATITSAWTNVLNYSHISTLIYTDQPSAINGFKVQFSSDGVNIDHAHAYTISANLGENAQIPIHSKYYRTSYTNGNVNQTIFRMQSILHPAPASGSIIEADDVISPGDDCLVTKAILTGQSVTSGQYINAAMTPDGGLVINQNIQVDPLNSSSANVAAGAFFTGATVSNITASMLQIFLKTDQNCTVYLDQSQDGINWDISDSYDYYASVGNFGINVGAFGAYYRIRVKNIGSVTTTYFRLQAVIVPIANQLPRSLSPQGWLQTAVNHIEDSTGMAQYYTPHGEQVSVPIFRLIGAGYDNNTLDTTLWTANIGTGGSANVTAGTLQLVTGTTANNVVSVQTVYTARFVEGAPNKFRSNFKFDTGVALNTRRAGNYNANDGAFFELSGTTLNLVTRKAGVDTKVANGTFTGRFGSTYILDANIHKWEIVLTKQAAFFYVDNNLIHKSSFNTTGVSWASTFHLPITFENFNTGGSTTNVTFNVLNGIVIRMGLQNTQPISKFQSGTTAGITYKNGAGSLQGVVLSNVTNTANVTLYDGTSITGPIIWSSGPMSAQTVPVSLDLKGIAFSSGLTISITSAACNTLVTYE